MTIDTGFLNQMDRFDLVVKKRVTSNYRGGRRSLAKGRGIVFKDHRIYAPGDDIRAVDWKVFARTDDLHVKTFEEELSLTVHIIVDGSKSMDFGKGFTKFDYASMLGIGFAYLTMKENEKFQFSVFADTLVSFKSRRGMHQLANTVLYLNKLKPMGMTNFKDIMEQYRHYALGKSLVVIISDFLFSPESIREGLLRLGKHDMKVIQVLDRVEKNLKFQGDMRLHDSETKDILRTYISPSLRIKYQKDMDEHSSKIQKVCNSLGVDFFQVVTDTPIFDAFYHILK